jgi:hypothetical protein
MNRVGDTSRSGAASAAHSSCTIWPSADDEVNTVAVAAASRPAAANACDPAASASFTGIPARRRSAGGSSGLGGTTAGAGRYGSAPASTTRLSCHPGSPGPSRPIPSTYERISRLPRR